MRAAFLLSPSSITRGRMGASKAALILMKNSHFDRTLRQFKIRTLFNKMFDIFCNSDNAIPQLESQIAMLTEFLHPHHGLLLAAKRSLIQCFSQIPASSVDRKHLELVKNLCLQQLYISDQVHLLIQSVELQSYSLWSSIQVTRFSGKGRPGELLHGHSFITFQYIVIEF